MTQLLEARTTTKGVWLGPEVKTPKNLEIPAASSRLIPVDLISARHTIPEQVIFSPTVISTRSRYAQLGGEFPNSVNIQIGKYLQSDLIPEDAYVPFINYSRAPILLEKGDVFRLMQRQGPPITGDALEHLIATEEIVMGGNQNEDWWPAKNANGKTVGVGLYITEPEEWLPPSKKPIIPQGATTETFREEMTKHLRTIQPGDKPLVRISDTNELFTSSNIMAFIEQRYDCVHPSDTRIVNPQHINSPALYGGYPPEPWRIRTETLSTYEELQQLNGLLPRKAIVVSFYPVINPLPHAA